MTSTSALARQLTKDRRTLAAAESCTGGLIAHTLTNVPGASAWFKGGIIAYANQAKTTFLGVPAALIRDQGAVSAPVAKAMAEGARQRFKTDLAIATTGIAGPTGGTREKPVGLVFIAVASAQRTVLKKCLFKGTRSSIKAQTLQTTLGLLNLEI